MIFQQFNLVNRLDVLTNVLIGGLTRVSTPRMLLRLFTTSERTRAVALLDRLGLFEVAMQRAWEEYCRTGSTALKIPLFLTMQVELWMQGQWSAQLNVPDETERPLREYAFHD